ncbi:hypothetical protein RF55_6047 [Lasius niger]|uniref:Uncharacterized protein n=1 Tax=Lasius niger TaxID=67767 RepID=A0A0J7KTR5_LASNI|nr:hypothetical protein RF55_6047 [Lasius niger]
MQPVQTHELRLAAAEPDTPAIGGYSYADSPSQIDLRQQNTLKTSLRTSQTGASPYIISLNSSEHYSSAGVPYEKPAYDYERDAGGMGLSAATKNKWSHKKGWLNQSLYAIDKFFNQPVPEQWSAGTLYELFPPSDKKGEWTIEPYFVSTVPNGQFNQLGKNVSDNPGSYSFAQQWYLQAGITDRLTVNIIPGYIYNWGGGERSGSVEVQDLPFDLLYRVTPDNQFPLVTVYLGGQAPVGPYDKLQNSNDGTGTGAWSFNFGVSSMMTFPFFGHALIADLWAQANQTTGDVRVKGMSTYGTDQAFNGWAMPSQFGSAGAGFEFGVTKKFMLDLELIGYWNAPVNMKGWEAGQWQRYQESGWTDVFDVGPGMEYSFNEHWSAVAEVIIPVAGINTTASLSPTAAIVCSY